ncbi:MAG: trypsin-like peptidase domain-containing protein [Phormidesmis sp.]
MIDFEVAKRAIVQIYPAQADNIVGTGFWVGGRYLMTCAHVVAAALGIPARQRHEDVKEFPVRLAFAEANQKRKRVAEIIYYQYQEEEGGKDAAVLKLSEDIDFECEPIYISTGLLKTSGARVVSFGYIDANSGGRNIDAETKGGIGSGGWLQVDSSKTQGLPVLEGISGAPVWCDRTGLVGMLVAREQRRSEDRIGFIIPNNKLSEPRRLIQSRLVCDALRSDEASIEQKIRLAYEVCRGHLISGPPHTDLKAMTDELANRGAGEQNKLLAFIACLLNDLERSAFDALINALTALAERFADDSEPIDFNTVRVKMREAVLAHQAQAPAQENPALWVSVCAADMTGTPPFSIEAWLVPNPEAYDPQTGKGALKLSSKILKQHRGVEGTVVEDISEESLDYAQIPLFMASYLDQVERGHDINQEDLTIELFLPISLMNQPIERMGIPDWMDVEPLGIGEMECPHVLLRSRDRLDQNSKAKSRWRKKWICMAANLHAPARDLLTKDRATLVEKLREENVIGFNLDASPSSAVGGELYKLVKAGAPFAIWLRDNPHAVFLAQQLEDDLLQRPLQEVSAGVMALRRETKVLTEADCSKSRELGYHLAFLWENPKHVPPLSGEPISNSPLA